MGRYFVRFESRCFAEIRLQERVQKEINDERESLLMLRGSLRGSEDGHARTHRQILQGFAALEALVTTGFVLFPQASSAKWAMYPTRKKNHRKYMRMISAVKIFANTCSCAHRSKYFITRTFLQAIISVHFQYLLSTFLSVGYTAVAQSCNYVPAQRNAVSVTTLLRLQLTRFCCGHHASSTVASQFPPHVDTVSGTLLFWSFWHFLKRRHHTAPLRSVACLCCQSSKQYIIVLYVCPALHKRRLFKPSTHHSPRFRPMQLLFSSHSHAASLFLVKHFFVHDLFNFLSLLHFIPISLWRIKCSFRC